MNMTKAEWFGVVPISAARKLRLANAELHEYERYLTKQMQGLTGYKYGLVWNRRARLLQTLKRTDP